MKYLDDSPYWTPERRELLRWFQERVPPFAEGYAAAVRLVHLPDFPARIHLICHLVRDIYWQLPRALGDHSKKSTPAQVYPPLVAELRKHWTMNPLKDEGIPSGSGRMVSAQVYSALQKLMAKSLDLKAQPSVGTRLAKALFQSHHRPVRTSIPGWIFKSFDREYDFFVSRAHLAFRRVPSDEGLLEHFESFERAFHSMVGSYFRGKEELDAILEDTNRPAD